MNKINAKYNDDLIAKCKRGDSLAQHQLFIKYYDSMFAVCSRIVSNQTDAEEIIQDAFVVAFSKIKKLRATAAFGTWLKHIVVNLSINFVKRTKKIALEEYSDDFIDEIPDESPIYNLSKQTISGAVAQLPDGCRIIFGLYLLDNYKHHEIARLLNISVSTSKSQYQRAKYILKEKLTQIINE